MVQQPGFPWAVAEVIPCCLIVLREEKYHSGLCVGWLLPGHFIPVFPNWMICSAFLSSGISPKMKNFFFNSLFTFNSYCLGNAKILCPKILQIKSASQLLCSCCFIWYKRDTGAVPPGSGALLTWAELAWVHCPKNPDSAWQVCWGAMELWGIAP